MGGTPLPPFTDKIFGKKGVLDLGGTPLPPFKDKIRKVIFDHLPKLKVWFSWRGYFISYSGTHCKSLEKLYYTSLIQGKIETTGDLFLFLFEQNYVILATKVRVCCNFSNQKWAYVATFATKVRECCDVDNEQNLYMN